MPALLFWSLGFDPATYTEWISVQVQGLVPVACRLVRNIPLTNQVGLLGVGFGCASQEDGDVANGLHPLRFQRRTKLLNHLVFDLSIPNFDFYFDQLVIVQGAVDLL